MGRNKRNKQLKARKAVKDRVTGVIESEIGQVAGNVYMRLVNYRAGKAEQQYTEHFDSELMATLGLAYIQRMGRTKDFEEFYRKHATRIVDIMGQIEQGRIAAAPKKGLFSWFKRKHRPAAPEQIPEAPAPVESQPESAPAAPEAANNDHA